MTQVAEYTADTTTLQSPPVGHEIFSGHSTTGRLVEDVSPYRKTRYLYTANVSVGKIDVDVTEEEGGQYFEYKSSFDTAVFPQEEPVKISSDANKHIRGHEQLLKKVYAMIREEAHHTSIPLLYIEVLADWSHEYDEHTGVVIYIGIQGTADERFALWDSIAHRLETLEGSLPPNERNFLLRNVSVVVNRT